MHEWFKYLFQELWPSTLAFSLQIVLAEMMFVHGQPKRSHPALRIVFGLLFYLLLCWSFPRFTSESYLWYPTPLTLIRFGLSILLLWFILNVSFKCVLMIALVSYAVQHLAYNLGDFMTQITGLERFSLPYYLVTFALFAFVYAVSYVVIVRRFNKNAEIYFENRICFLLAAGTIVLMFLRQTMHMTGILNDYELATLFAMISVVLLLFIQFGLLRQGRISEEKRIIEELLRAEENRRTMRQENIDIINMKCHDLRYHLDEYSRANAGSEHAQFFEEVAKSIDIYDNTPDTGIPALNALFAEKLLYCNANGIDVSYIIDKAAIERMSASDLYSLFGNAIDNAIQSVEKEAPEKRTVSISAQLRSGFGQVLFANYCANQPQMRDGLPVSSKDSTQHGFGLRSIRYIVEKYGGNMLVDYRDHIFTLSILLPQQDAK